MYLPSHRHWNIGDRVYYVTGEVKAPGRQLYAGQMTVTKAITKPGANQYFCLISIWSVSPNLFSSRQFPAHLHCASSITAMVVTGVVVITFVLRHIDVVRRMPMRLPPTFSINCLARCSWAVDSGDIDIPDDHVHFTGQTEASLTPRMGGESKKMKSYRCFNSATISFICAERECSSNCSAVCRWP